MKRFFLIIAWVLGSLQAMTAQQNVNALAFDGTNDYVSLGSSSLLKPTTALSIEAIANFSNWSATGTMAIVSASQTKGYSLEYQSGSIVATVYGNNTVNTNSFRLTGYTGWHNIALTFDRNYIRLYIDGTEKGNAIKAKRPYSIQYDNNVEVAIGGSSTGTSKFINGTIDEVRIWNKTLTAAQIRAAINTEVAATSANLVAYYRFNQGTAGVSNTSITTLTDLTSNRLNGSLKNFALTGTSSNWVEGYTLAAVNQASNIVFNESLATAVKISWTRAGANAGGNNIAVFMSAKTTGTAAPDNATTYTANTVYGSGTQIKSTGWYCVYNGTGTSVNVTGLTAGTTYRVHAIEYQKSTGLTNRYNSAAGTNNPANYLFAAPATQTSALASNTVSYSTFNLSWTRGNGYSVALFAKETSTGNTTPANNVSYTANSLYSSGSQIGNSGWYCIYNGTGTSTSISNLKPGTTYRIEAFEYNGTGGTEKYCATIASNTINVTTLNYAAPTTQASNLIATVASTSSINLNVSRGNGSKIVIFAAAANSGSPTPIANSSYIANAQFASGSQIGTSGWYCVYNNTGNSVTVTGLTLGATYRFAAMEYNGTASYEKYLTTISTNIVNGAPDYIAPTVNPTNLSASNISYNSFSLGWTRGNGTSTAVFIKEGSTGSATPANNSTYSANTVFKGGTQIDSTGWYCVYSGNGTNASISELTPGTAYRIMAVDFNGIQALEKYNTSSGLGNTINTNSLDYVAPTTQASNFTTTAIGINSVDLSLSRGNGSNVAIFAKANTVENPTPTNNTSYTANSTFGTGSQIATSGWYCVYNGTSGSVTVSGLTTGTIYRFAAIEYNGPSNFEKYFNSFSDNVLTATPDYAAPAVQASGISLSNISQTSLTASWTKGNGTNSIVFVGTSSSAIPANNVTYSANAQYGAGSQLTSGWYCAYSGNSNSVTISGLNAETSYTIEVFEFNGTTGLEKYQTTISSNNAATATTLSYTTTWNGSSWSIGAPDASIDAIINGNYTSSTSISCKNLTINGGFTLNIQAGSLLTVAGNLTNNGTLKLLSNNNSTPTGSLITQGTITNNGSMLAERYISPGTTASTNQQWHLMSLPNAGQLIQNIFLNDFVMKYAEKTNSWVGLVSGVNITSGEGFLVKTTVTGGKKATFTGTFNTGNFNFSVSNTGPDANHGYNLIGNPYPSAINWDANGWTKTNIGNTIWIWDPSNQRYMTWNGTVGQNGGTSNIPAMQAFFVKVNDNTATGTLGMTNSIRIHSAALYQKSAKLKPQMISLEASGNNFSDELVVYASEQDENTEKMFSLNEDVPQLYAILGENRYALIATSSIENQKLTIGFSSGREGSYSIKLKNIQLDEPKKIVLVDHFTNDSIELNSNNSYQFNFQSENADNRFELLVLNVERTSTAVVKEIQDDIQAWGTKNEIKLKLHSAKSYAVEMFSVEGKLLLKKEISGTDMSTISGVNKGIYLIRIYNNQFLYSKKVIVQ